MSSIELGQFLYHQRKWLRSDSNIIHKKERLLFLENRDIVKKITNGGFICKRLFT